MDEQATLASGDPIEHGADEYGVNPTQTSSQQPVASAIAQPVELESSGIASHDDDMNHSGPAASQVQTLTSAESIIAEPTDGEDRMVSGGEERASYHPDHDAYQQICAGKPPSTADTAKGRPNPQEAAAIDDSTEDSSKDGHPEVSATTGDNSPEEASVKDQSDDKFHIDQQEFGAPRLPLSGDEAADFTTSYDESIVSQSISTDWSVSGERLTNLNLDDDDESDIEEAGNSDEQHSPPEEESPSRYNTTDHDNDHDNTISISSDAKDPDAGERQDPTHAPSCTTILAKLISKAILAFLHHISTALGIYFLPTIVTLILSTTSTLILNSTRTAICPGASAPLPQSPQLPISLPCLPPLHQPLPIALRQGSTNPLAAYLSLPSYYSSPHCRHDEDESSATATTALQEVRRILDTGCASRELRETLELAIDDARVGMMVANGRGRVLAELVVEDMVGGCACLRQAVDVLGLVQKAEAWELGVWEDQEEWVVLGDDLGGGEDSES